MLRPVTAVLDRHPSYWAIVRGQVSQSVQEMERRTSQNVSTVAVTTRAYKPFVDHTEDSVNVEGPTRTQVQVLGVLSVSNLAVTMHERTHDCRTTEHTHLHAL